MRTVMITDIHGCFDQMTALLEKAQFDRERDTLVFGGDLMDRGPQSVKCFLYIKDLKDTLGERFVYVLGNHEQMLIDAERPGFLFRQSKRELWYYNGGLDTTGDFEKAGIPLRDAAVWLQEHTVLYYAGEGFQVLHADIVNDCALSEIPRHTAIWGRTVADKNLYRGPLTFLGHTPLRASFYFRGDGLTANEVKLEKKYRLPETGAIILDTGGVYGNRFTAAVIEDGILELFAVPG